LTALSSEIVLIPCGGGGGVVSISFSFVHPSIINDAAKAITIGFKAVPSIIVLFSNKSRYVPDEILLNQSILRDALKSNGQNINATV
jgi:hypothetical protein